MSHMALRVGIVWTAHVIVRRRLSKALDCLLTGSEGEIAEVYKPLTRFDLAASTPQHYNFQVSLNCPSTKPANFITKSQDACLHGESSQTDYSLYHTNEPKVTLKDSAPKEELDKAKQHVTDQGGKITNEFTLIKGFRYAAWRLHLPAVALTYYSAEIPDDVVSTLSSNEHVNVEADSEVRTQ